jgi:hypothetical protein
VAEWEGYKKEYATTHGQEVVDLLEKHAAAFYEINDKMMSAALGKPAK